MKPSHHKGFEDLAEMEIMAILVIGLLLALFLPIFLTELF